MHNTFHQFFPSIYAAAKARDLPIFRKRSINRTLPSVQASCRVVSSIVNEESGTALNGVLPSLARLSCSGRLNRRRCICIASR